jgi:DNA invertase Pin-like site-specific DNA recombinase
MKPAIGYLRVSGLGQVDKDGEVRQREAVEGFCKQNGLFLRGCVFEAGVSGAVEGLDRPVFRQLLEEIDSVEGEKPVIVIERLDRLARVLMVQEIILRECRERHIEVYAADQPFLDLASNDVDPSRKLFRQIMGALAEWEKSALVLKLRKARDRKRQETGRCEGPLPFHLTPEGKKVVEFISNCRQEPGNTINQTVEALNRAGLKTQTGKSWNKRAMLHVWRKSKGLKK